MFMLKAPYRVCPACSRSEYPVQFCALWEEAPLVLSVLPCPLYAPFFKVTNKVCKLLYTSLTSVNNRFKVRNSV